MRTVTRVLVDPGGELLGALPPIQVERPWWQEVHEFVGERGQVLRLLAADRPEPPGGHVTYLIETDERPAGRLPVQVDLAPHPKRHAYAEVGGPAATIAWARSELGRPVTVRQQRTWNLSATWRLDGPDGPVAWIKQVPPFFAHEPVALRLTAEIAPGLVPKLLAAGQNGRMLLAHAPGEDRYGAGSGLCARIAEVFHPIQAARIQAAEIPDGRLKVDRFARVAEPFHERIAGLRELIDGLPERFAAIEECGLPDTLVHGDLHPGNVRTDHAGRLTIMDWGDCTIGNPAFDILRLTGDLDDPEPLLRAWADRWQKTVPGCEPLRAVELLRPVAALRGAAIYSAFLDAIEPSEWPYHSADVPRCLAEAVAALS